MQTVNQTFVDNANADVRKLAFELRASFTKQFNDNINFFIISSDDTPESLLDGVDLLAPTGSDVVAEWDKYLYQDYTDRVISIEVTNEQIEPYSIVQSFADVTVNNFDGYFTPNSGSPIDQYILPKRPFRILFGFRNSTLPQFVGLSTTMPSIDKSARTAKFHLIDFLTFIFDREIPDSEMLTDVTTGDALDYIFQEVGLLPGQYVLDETSFNTIPFFYVEKGQKVGTVIKELMEAEQGRLYMDEFGIIRFLNRQNYNTDVVWSFDDDTIINYGLSTEDDVINFTRIHSDILQEYTNTSLWGSAQAYYIAAGQSIEVWADLPDLQTNVDDPVYSETEIEQSYFTSTLDQEGETPYTDVVLGSIDKFAKAVKMVFENTGLNNAYITKIELWGTAVRVADTIIVEDFDQDSIDNFDERRYELKTRYIQKESDAISKAAIIIDDYKDFGSIWDLEVKGTMALQVGDVITVDVDGTNGDYIITKIVQILADGRYQQRLKVKNREFRVYFILSSDSEARSLLDGDEVLIP